MKKGVLLALLGINDVQGIKINQAQATGLISSANATAAANATANATANRSVAANATGNATLAAVNVSLLNSFLTELTLIYCLVHQRE